MIKKFNNIMCCFFFFFKQKTAYEIRPCDWSSDVCSSDLELDAVLGTVISSPTRDVGGGTVILKVARSEERRVGKECTVLCRSGWWPYHLKKKKANIGREPGRAHLIRALRSMSIV